ncbi:hypothetical protein JZ751_027551, partial [Albula glossodonta]
SSVAAPTLSLLPPSSEELKTTKATLVCVAQTAVGFADFSWTSNGSPVSDGVFTSTAKQQSDKNFGLSSFLTIKPSEWMDDRVFSCKVSVGSKHSEKSVNGVTVVTQKPPVLTVSKGGTATLDCNLGTVTDSGARWYKQVPGGVPQYQLPVRCCLASPKETKSDGKSEVSVDRRF